MPSTYSNRLRLELIATGEQSGTWGDTTNTNLGTLLDQAIAGVATITMSDANYTLTTADGATDEARQAVIVLTGTLSASRNVICPDKQKVYIVKNSTTGGFSIVFKTSAGTGVTVANGITVIVYCDGTNVNLVTAPGSTVDPTFTGNISLDGATVVNESGADKDFRVEGDTDANLLFTDASTDRVGIGINTPATKLDLFGAASQNIVAVSASAVDCSAGNFFTKTASGALSWTATNVPSSRAYSFLLELTNGGTGTQTWFTNTKWPNGSAPVLATSGVDVLGFLTDDGGTTWRGVQLMKDSK